MTGAQARTISIVIAAALAAAIGACTDPNDEGRNTEEEIGLFKDKLTAGKSFAQACQELDVLCKTTGFGCAAHSLFCQVPDKQTVCQQLAAACTKYPAACDVYNNHCKAPAADAGMPLLDAPPLPGQCGDGFCDWKLGETCGSCPKDCKCSKDAGMPWTDTSIPLPGKCGNGFCEWKVGESCYNCPKDCKCVPDAAVWWGDF